jgi:tRNA isopentenyl-2-thiomethyl-A-37 hydroxylase MiaE
MSGDRNMLNQSIFTDEDGNPLTLNPYAGNRDNNAQFYKNLDVESRARYYGDELKLNKDLSKQTFSEEDVKKLFKGTEVDSNPKQSSRNEFATRNDNDL